MAEEIKKSKNFIYRKDSNPEKIIFTINDNYDDLNNSWKEHFLRQLNNWILKEFKGLKDE